MTHRSLIFAVFAATSPGVRDVVTARPSVRAAVRLTNPGACNHRRHLHPAEVRGHGDIHRRSLPTTTLGWQILADRCITGVAS